MTSEPWPPWYDRLVLMFQREVAERLVASPDSKTYGRLSVLTQWRTSAKILFDIAPSAFVPPPKVTSSVVELVPRRPVDVALHWQVARLSLPPLARLTDAVLATARERLL